MRLYFRMAVAYAIVSLTIVAISQGSPLAVLSLSVGATLTATGANALVVTLPVVLVLALIVGWSVTLERGRDLLYAVFGMIILQLGFTFLKSGIPNMVPFYADPMLARVDRALLLGRDAWQVAHALVPPADANRLLPVYVHAWTICAITMPAAVALTDRDKDRIFRFVVLCFVVWIGLGNVFALMFSSVGPVFYDNLLGGGRFSDLTAALMASGVSDSAVGRLQHYLWAAYASRNLELGSGISAFPSVHLGIATATAIYLGERSRWLILPGVLFVAVIFYLSLYTGYHYAIDGYFSIALVLAAWAVVLRYQRSRCQRAFTAQIDAEDGLPQSGR